MLQFVFPAGRAGLLAASPAGDAPPQRQDRVRGGRHWGFRLRVKGRPPREDALSRRRTGGRSRKNSTPFWGPTHTLQGTPCPPHSRRAPFGASGAPVSRPRSSVCSSAPPRPAVAEPPAARLRPQTPRPAPAFRDVTFPDVNISADARSRCGFHVSHTPTRTHHTLTPHPVRADMAHSPDIHTHKPMLFGNEGDLRELCSKTTTCQH